MGKLSKYQEFLKRSFLEFLSFNQQHNYLDMGCCKSKFNKSEKTKQKSKSISPFDSETIAFKPYSIHDDPIEEEYPGINNTLQLTYTEEYEPTIKAEKTMQNSMKETVSLKKGDTNINTVPAEQKLSKDEKKAELFPRHLLKIKTQNKLIKTKGKDKRTTLRGKQRTTKYSKA